MAPVGDMKRKLRIYGLYSDIMFQKAKGIAEAITTRSKDDFEGFDAVGMMEFEWSSFLEETKKREGGEAWGFSGACLVYDGFEFIGSTDDFAEWAKLKYDFEDFRPLPLLYAVAREEYKQFLLCNNHDFVFMDVSVGGETLGRIVFELYTSKCPRTCENFKSLCLGDKEESVRHIPALPLKYKDSLIHRIVRNGWVQGGDFERGSGDGGESIYGPTFDDENFSVKHDKRGILGMANSGRHSNGSQFYITLQPAPWMDTQYVAFGEVVEGSAVLRALEEQETYNERPIKECRIQDCGVMDRTVMSKVT